MTVRRILAAALAGLPVACPLAWARDEPETPAAKPSAGAVIPPKPADGDAPLPKGFPEATAPGMIEVKTYPAYRSAVAKRDDLAADGDGSLFMPLFRHIRGEGIAMTAPVISTFETPGLVEQPGKTGQVVMEFLYREPDQGRTGPGVGPVTVADQPGGRYLCLGVQGTMTERRMREGLERLRAWLKEHPDRWVEAGPPRRLGYHGPMTLPFRRLWEIQLPVRPTEGAEPAKPAP